MTDVPATETPIAAKPKTLLPFRLLSLLYDFFPMLGVWFLVGLIAVVAHGGEPIRADTLAGWLELLALVSATGLYAVLSWRLGGQTLGMRPWRLRVTDAAGGSAGYGRLIGRYLVGTLSLLLGGLGFWWAWFDRDRLTWHDRASGTRLVRVSKA